jgi:beta-glucosidase/6-phospho-beta-glucosidase/beta-galactosidase
MTGAGAFDDWVWASGEEASDPIVLRAGEPYRVDELACSGHLERQDQDLADVARLGLGVFRYGMPWRLTEPEPGTYDWRWWDAALAACDRHGLEPVVDLCHFGLPDHLAGFTDPAWVEAFLRYVDAFLARYRRPRWFTPVNEPLTTANLSARYGMWNERVASEEQFALALSLCTLANLEAHHRIVADRGGWSIGAEAVRVPAAPPATEAEARNQALHAAPWDLAFGHPLDPLVEATFATVDDGIRSRLADLTTTEHVVAGHDPYPVSVVLDPLTIAGCLDAYEQWARRWHATYQVPFWVAETSNLGFGPDRQVDWLHAFVDRLRAMRADGLPVRGLCWYSRGDQFDWQTALCEPTGALTEVGLFTHDRQPRPVAAALAALVAAGAP